MFSRARPRTSLLRSAVLQVVCTVLALSLPANAAEVARPARVSVRRAEREQQRLVAGHLLRRLGFGPDRREMRDVLRRGIPAYIDRQLHPESIDDRVGERLFRPVPTLETDTSDGWQLRWLTRMAYSRRQLQEKMALIWHEHFATSVGKVGSYVLMRDQENLFRENGLGSFRDLLVAVTKDNAMLIFLDNSYNNGQAYDGEGNLIPPNENYARELLQLFALGVYRLNMDGTLQLDPGGAPVAAYTEADVREVARALTGWFANYPSTDPEDPGEIVPAAGFDPSAHDPEQKIALGEVIPADYEDGAADVERVVDILMAHPNTAPFIAKELIQKLATETPSPGYVERIATVFATSRGDIRAAVRAILTDAEFTAPEVVRTQYKEPIEHIVGALRGLGARTQGIALFHLTNAAGQLVYLPPSVFSFYRPGQKVSLVNARYVAVRDQAADILATGYTDDYFDATWDAAAVVRRRSLYTRPGRAIDFLAEELLAAPLSPELRRILLDYAGPRVTEEKLRGIAWLILCSQDYQLN